MFGRYEPPDSISLLRLATTHALVLVATLVNPAIEVLGLDWVDQSEVLIDCVGVFFQLPRRKRQQLLNQLDLSTGGKGEVGRHRAEHLVDL